MIWYHHTSHFTFLFSSSHTLTIPAYSNFLTSLLGEWQYIMTKFKSRSWNQRWFYFLETNHRQYPTKSKTSHVREMQPVCCHFLLNRIQPCYVDRPCNWNETLKTRKPPFRVYKKSWLFFRASICTCILGGGDVISDVYSADWFSFKVFNVWYPIWTRVSQKTHGSRGTTPLGSYECTRELVAPHLIAKWTVIYRYSVHTFKWQFIVILFWTKNSV